MQSVFFFFVVLSALACERLTSVEPVRKPDAAPPATMAPSIPAEPSAASQAPSAPPAQVVPAPAVVKPADAGVAAPKPPAAK